MAAKSKIWSFVLICAVGIAGIAASLVWQRRMPDIPLATGRLVPPSSIADFSLIDHHGRAFTAANLRGHWSLMFFGYTNCPDFCPTTLTTLAAMQKRLRAAKEVLPQVVFISVDAKRDTPQQLAKYVPYFDPQFIGLTAVDQPSIAEVARKLGVAVIIVPTSGENYTVDHSGAIFVLNPDAQLTAVLTGPFTVDAVQSDFERIVSGRGILAGR